ncbi:MAG: dephospho-CoA kinase [Opitutaceae bacterium]
MFKVGITGGMGCGKSTVARLLESRGFLRIDSDAIVRDRVLREAPVKAALVSRWGGGVLDSAGEVDRGAVAERIFSDDGERRWLEDVVHPRVLAAWEEAFAAAPEKRWAVEVPLLFERGLEKGFDFTVCVALSPDQQLARLEERGIPRALAGRRISKQLPLAQKIDRSDFVLWNEGSPEFLEAQVDRMVRGLAAA